MSQSGSLNGPGGGGGGGSQFVSFTTLTGPIDFKTIQTVLIYTPARDFYLQSMVIKGTSIVNLTIGASIQLGTNGPTYDNLFSSTTYQPNASNTFETFTSSITDSVLVPAGTPIYLNITGGATATTATGEVFLTGVLF